LQDNIEVLYYNKINTFEKVIFS